LGGLAFGALAGSTVTSPKTNIYLATTSAPPISSGYYNLFIGNNAGNAITSGYQNVFIGYSAGQSNTTGNTNVFVGYQAGQNCTTTDNTIVGGQAGVSLTTGQYNCLIGSLAGYSLTTPSNNTMIGTGAGLNTTTGSGNIVIGYQAQTSATTSNADSNCIVIGDGLNGNGTNTTTIGNSSITDVYLNASGSVHCSGSLIINNNLTFNNTQNIYLAAGINWYVGGGQVGYFDNPGSTWRISAATAPTLSLQAPTTLNLQISGSSLCVLNNSVYTLGTTANPIPFNMANGTGGYMGFASELASGTTPLLNMHVNFRGSVNTANVGGLFRIDGRNAGSTPLFQWASRLPGSTTENVCASMDYTGALSIQSYGTSGSGWITQPSSLGFNNGVQVGVQFTLYGSTTGSTGLGLTAGHSYLMWASTCGNYFGSNNQWFTLQIIFFMTAGYGGYNVATLSSNNIILTINTAGTVYYQTPGGSGTYNAYVSAIRLH
jgi:hypothetical protein